MGTQREHLSVLDYKKEMRAEEVEKLTIEAEKLHDSIEYDEELLKVIQAEKVTAKKEYDNLLASYEDKENEERKIFEEVHWQGNSIDTMDSWRLPEPETFTIRGYIEKQLNPFWEVVKRGIKGFVQRIKDLKQELREANFQIHKLEEDKNELKNELNRTKESLVLEKERSKIFEEQADKLYTLKRAYGSEYIDSMADKAEKELIRYRGR